MTSFMPKYKNFDNLSSFIEQYEFSKLLKKKFFKTYMNELNNNCLFCYNHPPPTPPNTRSTCFLKQVLAYNL